MVKLVYGDIAIDPFLKAIKKFKEFRKDIVTDRDKAGAIQAFEYCYELSWKMLKKVLAKHSIRTHSSRDVFREAALLKMIVNPEEWFEFLELRNLTVHTYNEESADKIIASFDTFEKALDHLVVVFENLPENERG